MAEKLERYVTVKEVAEFLTISPNTIYFWTHTKFIPHYWLPKGIRFKMSEVESWMKRRKVVGRETCHYNVHI